MSKLYPIYPKTTILWGKFQTNPLFFCRIFVTVDDESEHEQASFKRDRCVTAYTHVCNEEFVQRCIRSCKAFRQFSHFKLWFFSTWGKSWQRVLEKENIEQQWTAVLCASLVHFRTFQHHPKAGGWRAFSREEAHTLWADQMRGGFRFRFSNVLLRKPNRRIHTPLFMKSRICTWHHRKVLDEKQCILTTFDVCADVLREVEALVRAVVRSLSHTFPHTLVALESAVRKAMVRWMRSSCWRHL